MAEYQVTCVVKPNRHSQHEHITQLGGPAGGGWILPTPQVITLIKQGEVFYTWDGQNRADIEVKTNLYSGLEFVQTRADRDSRNNLLNLEACPL
jgi:hypothetical protein